MEHKSNFFWTIYKKLERDIIDLSYYIHFSDKKTNEEHNQIWTYSNQIADLLISINIQIESLIIELWNREYGTKFEGNIGSAIKDINNKWKLDKKSVKIICKNMYFTDERGFGGEFAPMSYESHDNNDYYVAYCAVKHNRIKALFKANVNVLVRALVALFILNVYYSFENIEVDEISGFDFSLGSDVFMVSYSTCNSSTYTDVLVVREDVDYLKKIEAYAEAIPDINDGFLKFRDEIKEPKRFTVELNIGNEN